MILHWLVTLLLFNSCKSYISAREQPSKVKLQVFTTAGCTDTANFIRYQLAPTYESYKDYLEVEFIPWGRSNSPDRCQFGKNDCYANKVQRCTLNSLKDEPDKQMQYMLCEFSKNHRTYLTQSTKCSESVGVAGSVVTDCLKSGLESKLAEEARNRTLEPMRVINFVPALVFEDVLDVKTMKNGFENLSGTLCNMIKDTSADFECL